jgi:hypothetical protein
LAEFRELRSLRAAEIPEKADPIDLPRLLCLGGERRGEEYRARASEKRATV